MSDTKRLVITICILMAWAALMVTYNMFGHSFEAAAAVRQVEDSAVTYGAANVILSGTLVTTFGRVCVALIALLWIPVAWRGLVTMAALFMLPACMGPAMVEQFEEIGPNQTAYVIPLEGATGDSQAKFNSVKFLEDKKVASKRISLSLREKSTGRGYWDYEWIPTVRVIKVDRAPVTREWTASHTSGTAGNDQSMHMQSLDSIMFHIGATITASIAEEDASAFLYHFGGKELHSVVDTNIRSFLLGELSGKFAAIKLDESMKDKTTYFAEAGNDAKTYFKQRGITIDYFGIEGGLGYDNDAVQKSLDSKFIAENDKLVAQNEQAAQVVRNQTAVAKATADADAATKFAAAKDALTVKTQMEALKLQAEATKIAAQRWDGKLGAIVPAGSNMLFGLDHSGAIK